MQIYERECSLDKFTRTTVVVNNHNSQGKSELGLPLSSSLLCSLQSQFAIWMNRRIGIFNRYHHHHHKE